MNLIFRLGNQPELAQKEIEAIATILPFPWTSSMLSVRLLQLKLDCTISASDVFNTGYWSGKNHKLYEAIATMQNRLGGTISIAQEIATVPYREVGTTVERLVTLWADESRRRIRLGISWLDEGRHGQTGRLVKESLTAAGYSLRYVMPRQRAALSSAQIFHNRLAALYPTGQPRQDGLEVILYLKGAEVLVGFTLTIQDINSYSQRDFGIPVPDPVSGMLPPKLAQTMINLAVGGNAWTVYDPFCGNGRVMGEAALMGLATCGSDIEPKKVEASKTNLAWLGRTYNLDIKPEEMVRVVDARALQDVPQGDWVVVSEPYLGKPLRHPLAPQEQGPWLQELEGLYEEFFRTMKKISHRPRALVMVFPAARLAGEKGELSLFNSLVDRIDTLGYSSTRLGRYMRPDSLVGRDIIRLTFVDKP